MPKMSYIGGCCQRHSLSPDLGWEDLRWIGPRGRSPGGSKSANEEVGHRHDSFGNWLVVIDEP